MISVLTHSDILLRLPPKLVILVMTTANKITEACLSSLPKTLQILILEKNSIMDDSITDEVLLKLPRGLTNLELPQSECFKDPIDTLRRNLRFPSSILIGDESYEPDDE